jgi:hypothetical protein
VHAQEVKEKAKVFADDQKKKYEEARVVSLVYNILFQDFN